METKSLVSIPQYLKFIIKLFTKDKDNNTAKKENKQKSELKIIA